MMGRARSFCSLYKKCPYRERKGGNMESITKDKSPLTLCAIAVRVVDSFGNVFVTNTEKVSKGEFNITLVYLMSFKISGHIRKSL